VEAEKKIEITITKPGDMTWTKVLAGWPLLVAGLAVLGISTAACLFGALLGSR
jgi:hypothetical protein